MSLKQTGRRHQVAKDRMGLKGKKGGKEREEGRTKTACVWVEKERKMGRGTRRAGYKGMLLATGVRGGWTNLHVQLFDTANHRPSLIPTVLVASSPFGTPSDVLDDQPLIQHPRRSPPLSAYAYFTWL